MQRRYSRLLEGVQQDGLAARTQNSMARRVNPAVNKEADCTEYVGITKNIRSEGTVSMTLKRRRYQA